jgi:hypothetical protein
MWPDVNAVETFELSETDGVTTFSWDLAFEDKAGRAHMSGFDGEVISGGGQLDSLDAMEEILRSLAEPNPA